MSPLVRRLTLIEGPRDDLRSTCLHERKDGPHVRIHIRSVTTESRNDGMAQTRMYAQLAHATGVAGGGGGGLKSIPYVCSFAGV